jgi:hypothetical protein
MQNLPIRAHMYVLQLMQEVSNKGPSKGELKLKAKVESLKNQITDHESKCTMGIIYFFRVNSFSSTSEQ